MPKQQVVLLIEDEKFIAHVYKDALEKDGLKVNLALNGQEGLNQLKIEKPDIILLDLVMPIIDGFEVLKNIRSTSEYAQIPVIVLTNLSQEEDMEQVKKLGISDYLVKSNVSLRQVLNMVHQYLPPS